jgi:hypothetical protein
MKHELGRASPDPAEPSELAIRRHRETIGTHLTAMVQPETPSLIVISTDCGRLE